VASKDKLIGIISKLTGKPVSEIVEGSALVSDLGMDSISRLELINQLEQEFILDLGDTAINQHTTVSDLRRTIQKRENSDVPLSLQYWPNTFLGRALREIFDFALHNRIFMYFAKKLEVSGLENIKGLNMPVIFISNHTSYIDHSPIAFSLPRAWRYRTATAAREEFFFGGKNRFFKFFKLALLEYLTLGANLFMLPQKRGFRKSLKFMGRLVDNGINILFFPEGERSWDGKILPFMPGLGIIVHELKVPVVPIRVRGMEKVLPRGAVFPKRSKVTVTFGKPLHFTTETPSEIVEKARDAVMGL